MQKILLIVGLLTVCMQTHAAQQAQADPRYNLGLQGADKVQFLAEMRQMLASIQGVLEGIAEEDREKIKAAARYSGNRMARATPDSVRSRLPQGFREIGGPTHLMFEELVIRADTDEMEDLVEFASDLMKQCLACHARYRAD
jgi:hypothetical protein